ncbi:MAG TPA: STAS domain-containing protein [Gemmatimonas sp.]|nr:STAS domain-containing protein [Gemmatimonas sp.]
MSDTGIAIDIEQHGTVTVVCIRGSIDALTADQLVDALGDQLRAGQSSLVADFAGVEYTSSAGLRVLLTTLKDARQRGGDLRLCEIRPNVRQVLEMSGFTSILKCYADSPAAVASFSA